MVDVEWEGKADGSFEAWHAPNGTKKRSEKTYLGRVGKRRLDEWLAKAPDHRGQIVAEWITEKRVGKGII